MPSLLCSALSRGSRRPPGAVPREGCSRVEGQLLARLSLHQAHVALGTFVLSVIYCKHRNKMLLAVIDPQSEGGVPITAEQWPLCFVSFCSDVSFMLPQSPALVGQRPCCLSMSCSLPC